MCIFVLSLLFLTQSMSNKHHEPLYTKSTANDIVPLTKTFATLVAGSCKLYSHIRVLHTLAACAVGHLTML